MNKDWKTLLIFPKIIPKNEAADSYKNDFYYIFFFILVIMFDKLNLASLSVKCTIS